MKLVRYIKYGNKHIGVLEGDKVYEVIPYGFTNMVSLIQNFKYINMDERINRDNPYDLNEIQLVSPITKPIHDIICVGRNYPDYIEEFGEDSDAFNANYFGKRAVKILGTKENVVCDFSLDEIIDYEVELAVIIGSEIYKPKNKEEALESIFGYSIFNDMSARRLQMDHKQWYRGKSLNNFAIMGPYIITKDEIDYPLNLDIKSYVNGELRQNSNTKNMIHSVADIVFELSSSMTLEPGDIIATGTPSGVGIAFNPPKTLKKGDIVKCSIENLGDIENKII